MKAKIRLFAVSCLMPLCLLGCDRKASNAAATTESLDIVNAASQGRFPSAGSAVDAKDVSKSIRLDVSTYFPIWSDNVAATFDVVITNTTQAFVSARLIPKVVIFDEQQNHALFWSAIDLGNAFTLESQRASVLSLPVGANKTFASPVKKLQWASTNADPWPEHDFYSLVPTGKYALRLELNIFDDSDQRVDMLVSDFVPISVMSEPRADI